MKLLVSAGARSLDPGPWQRSSLFLAERKRDISYKLGLITTHSLSDLLPMIPAWLRHEIHNGQLLSRDMAPNR